MSQLETEEMHQRFGLQLNRTHAGKFIEVLNALMQFQFHDREMGYLMTVSVSSFLA